MRVVNYAIALLIFSILFGTLIKGDALAYFNSNRFYSYPHRQPYYINRNTTSSPRKITPTVTKTPTPTRKPTPTPTNTPTPTLTPTPTQVEPNVTLAPTPFGENEASGNSGSLKPLKVNPMCISSHIEEEDITPANLDRQLNLMQAAGTEWVRFDFVWDNIEMREGKYDWTYYDNLVNKVNAKGMKVIALVADWGIPEWEDQDIDSEAFGSFAKALASHYKGKVTMYEIGNEPNLNDVSAADYTEMLIAASKGIRSIDATNRIISAGLAIDDKSGLSYVQQMYDNGAKGYFDYLGMHPYSWPFSPDENNGGWGFSILKDVKKVMVKNGDTSKQIIATEVGWPSTRASGGVDEATQALFVGSIYETVSLNPNFQFVPIICVYDLIDDGADREDPEHNFGILRADYTPKPVYTVLKNLSREFELLYSPKNP